MALREFREVHLGMEFRIVLDLPPQDDGAALARQVYDRVDSLDQVLSDWLPGSELSRLQEVPANTWHPISTELAAVLSTALDVAQRTNGQFDPTIGPLTQLWRLERETGRPASDSVRSDARRRVDWRQLDLDPSQGRVRFRMAGMRLDLGGIAKGWILGQAADLLRSHGQSRFLLEAGGDLVLGDAPSGSEGWRIRVQREHGDTVVSLQRVALATSGPSAQSLVSADGSKASHVIDLRLGSGSTSPLQVTVIGRDAAVTDALATALTLVPVTQWRTLLGHYRLELLAPRR